VSFRVPCIHLVGNFLVILAGVPLSYTEVHQPREGREHVDGRVDALPVQLPADHDLPFRDVPGQVRYRVGDIVTGHGEDGELGDGAFLSFHNPCPLVDPCKIRVHVPGVTTPSGHLFTGGTDLPERLAV